MSQSVADGHRTIGRTAWHIVQTVPEMTHEAGLDIDTGILQQPVPDSAAEIATAYKAQWQTLIDAVQQQWTDADLLTVTNMYGMEWERGRTLMCLLAHEAHHCGQLTVLMRQAGLPVHGVFGPSKDEWAEMGAPVPEI